MKKSLIILAVLLLGTLFTQNVNAANGISPAGPALVQNLTATVDGSQVTLSVSGRLSVIAQSPQCFDDASFSVTYSSMSEAAIYTNPSNALVVTAGPSGMLNQTIPVTIVEANPLQGDCFTKAGFSTFSGSRVFTNVPAGNHTVTVQVTDNNNRTAQNSVSFTVAATNYTVTAKVSNTVGGSVTSTNPTSVVPDTPTSFTLTPSSSSYVVNKNDVTSDSANCLLNPDALAAWSGNTYTTGKINASCAYTFKFDLVGTVNGSHDGSSGNQASTSCNAFGWAAFSSQPGTDLTIGILSDGVPVYYGPAGEYRGDLTGQCTGGTCAFNVDLSDRISSGVNHSITVQAQNPVTSGWHTLSGSPKTLNCTAAPTAPATPAGLTATASSSCGTGTINVAWNSVSGAIDYTLRDGTTVIYTGASTSFSHTGLVAGSSHSYTVRANNSSGSSIYSNTVSATAPAACAPTDACGTYSGATPRLTEPTTNPTACNPGTYANSPADTTTLGAQAWNWSCGVVTSCTAPKYGCRIQTDSNYNLPQYGPLGPNNNYGCAGTCANGGTDYSTCTPPAGMSGTLSAPNCTIASGASSCTTTVSWNVTNPEIVGGSSVTSSYPSAGTVVAPPVSTGTADVGTKTGVTIPYSSRTFYLYNNESQLNSATASATCTSGTSWNGSICVPGMTGTLTPTTDTFCVISSGESECTLDMDWSVENPVATPTAITANGMSNINVSTSLTPASQSGTQSVPVPYNTRTFYLYNNAVLLAQSTVSSSCEEDTGWDGSVCVVGGGTPDSSEPPVVTIWATPTSGTVNQVNPVIGWEVTNAPTSCTATDDWSGARAAGGTQFQGVLDTVKTYTYTLTCENVYGVSDPASANVVVQSSASNLTINASPNQIYAGASSTLTWVGAGTCTGTNFDNGGLASGNLVVNPIVTTTYTLTCDGAPVSTTLRVLKKPSFIED
jgi:hypothetical protein